MFEYSSTNKTTSSKSFAMTNTTTLQKKPEGSSSNQIANIIANSSAASIIQTKLSIGKPNDKYEKEADMMADKVMTPPANFNKIQKRDEEELKTQQFIQKKVEKEEKPQAKLQLQEEEKEEPQAKLQLLEEEEPQAKEIINRQEKEEPVQSKIQKQVEEEEPVQSKIQKQVEEEEPVQSKIQKQAEEEEPLQSKVQNQVEEEEPVQSKIQKQVEEEEPVQSKVQNQVEEEEPVQSKIQKQVEEEEPLQSKVQNQVEEEEPVQSKIQKQVEEEEPVQSKIQKQADNTESASTDLSTRLSNNKGSGATISDSTRTFMEGQFSEDFTNVKVHTDRNAIGMSNELGAQAFTYGSDIYFNEGKYNPDTSGGKHLLAHELTHTIQQGAVRRKNTSVEITSPKIQRFSLKGILNKIANYIPGYSLITVILGKNPITGDKVPRTGINILKGVLGLIPVVGNMLFNRLKETGAAEKAGTWLDAQITKLDITWSGIKALISEAWDRMSIWKGISGNIAVAKKVFGPTLRRIKVFVSAITTKLKEFILDAALSLAGGAAKSVMDVFKKGKAVFNKILDDPIGFVKNFLKAVKLGINQFATNFGKHFKNAIFGWLFGTMAEAGIELPKKFDLKGIFNLVMQILGLTYNRIRTKLVKKLGSKGETIVSVIEKGITFVKKLITEGPIALWEKMKESLGDLKKKIMTAVLAWVTKTIIFKAMMKLAMMFNPVGALIQAAIAIYNTVMFFIERWNQIKIFVTSIFNSISNIAYGKIKGAANYIENTMAKGLTLLISFLARFVGLGGISKKIQNVIKKIRKPIDKALDKIIDWLVKKGKALFAKGKAAVKKSAEKIKGLLIPDKKFKAFNEDHTLKIIQVGNKHDILIQSPEFKVKEFIRTAESKDPSAQIITKLKTLETKYDKWKEKKEDTPANKRKKEKDYYPISKLIIEIMTKHRVTDLKKTEPKWTNESSYDGSDKRATGVVADPLTKKGDEGSSPKDSIPGWNTKRGESFIRVHLLHHLLHGPGTAKNLVAASDRINKQLYAAVESHEIEAVKKQKLIKHEVSVKYETNPDRVWKRNVVKSLEAKAKDKETSAVIGSYFGVNY